MQSGVSATPSVIKVEFEQPACPTRHAWAQTAPTADPTARLRLTVTPFARSPHARFVAGPFRRRPASWRL